MAMGCSVWKIGLAKRGPDLRKYICIRNRRRIERARQADPQHVV